MKTSGQLEQLRQRVIATHHLDAMDADEVRPYVEHRLKRAGRSVRPSMTDEAVDAIYEETRGVPRKINAVMNRALLLGSVEQLDKFDGDLISAVVADMAGQPFDYKAPLSAHGEVALPAEPAEPADPVEPAQQTYDAAAVEVVEPMPIAESIEREPIVVDTASEVALAEAQTPAQVIALPETNANDIAVKSAEPAAMEVSSFAAPTEYKTELHSADDETQRLKDRITELEARIAEQDASLRRTLATLTSWMEKENHALAAEVRSIRAA
jgi:hypothetical protein